MLAIMSVIENLFFMDIKWMADCVPFEKKKFIFRKKYQFI